MARNYKSVCLLIVCAFLMIYGRCNKISEENLQPGDLDAPLPVRGLFTAETTTETLYRTTEHYQSHWYGNWYQKIRNAMSSLKQRLGFSTSNVTTGLDTDRQFFYGTQEPFKHYVQAIYPGTLWCGRGNKAKFTEELGRYKDTDSCCREHDKCPESIRPNQSKHGLENTGLFTRSHCDCDLQFYNCLKQVNSIVSRQMGVTYFNVLRPQCFKLERPVRDCAVVYRRRCILYEYENSDKLEYQWFDVPKY